VLIFTKGHMYHLFNSPDTLSLPKVKKEKEKEKM